MTAEWNDMQGVGIEGEEGEGRLKWGEGVVGRERC